MNRRTFLALGGAAAAGMVLDPERLLWVPGARTFFLPSTPLVEAATMEEAISQGFVAVFPDGSRMEVVIGGANEWSTLELRLECEHRAVHHMGGRIVENRQYVRHEVGRGT